MIYWVYLLKCADGSYYTGSTTDLKRRVAEHQTGALAGYTRTRRPVTLMWSAEFSTHDEAFRRERQIKGWSRAKKEALSQGDWEVIHQLVTLERKTRDANRRK